MVIGKGLFTKEEHFNLIKEVDWKAIMIDEFHEYKEPKTHGYQNVITLQTHSRMPSNFRPVIGLTGTPMQNKHKEFWSLSHIIDRDAFGTYNDFKETFEQPIKLARKKDAMESVVAKGKRASKSLREKLDVIYLARKKEEVLKDTLKEKVRLCYILTYLSSLCSQPLARRFAPRPTLCSPLRSSLFSSQDENVIFCEMSEFQKLVYKKLLTLPDFQLIIKKDHPCDCSVNAHIFQQFQRMVDLGKDEKSQNLFLKSNPATRRGKCCGQIPLIGQAEHVDGDIEGEIDQDAVIWLKQHRDEVGCKNCPSCIALPCMNKLYKACSHISLLQARQNPADMDPNEYTEATIQDFQRELRFAELIFNDDDDLRRHLPNESLFRSHSITDDHHMLSGKLKMMSMILQKFKRKNDRCLVFSQSTQTLDIIEKWVQSKGFKFLRLDGSTPTTKRQGLVDEFQRDPSIFLFLISTKAGGMGLNLTAANRVLIFDVNWNPSHDEQAQDRSYRIGQKKNVQVYRLVTRGCIEEKMYMRQIYKSHLKKESLESQGGDDNGETTVRLFMGVANDNRNQGELFGVHNLFMYKDGSFMTDAWASAGMMEEERNDGLGGIPVYNDSNMEAIINHETMQLDLDVEGADKKNFSLVSHLGTRNLDAMNNGGAFNPKAMNMRIKQPAMQDEDEGEGEGEGEGKEGEGKDGMDVIDLTTIKVEKGGDQKGGDQKGAQSSESQRESQRESQHSSQFSMVADFLRNQSSSQGISSESQMEDLMKLNGRGGRGGRGGGLAAAPLEIQESEDATQLLSEPQNSQFLAAEAERVAAEKKEQEKRKEKVVEKEKGEEKGSDKGGTKSVLRVPTANVQIMVSFASAPKKAVTGKGTAAEDPEMKGIIEGMYRPNYHKKKKKKKKKKKAAGDEG